MAALVLIGVPIRNNARVSYEHEYYSSKEWTEEHGNEAERTIVVYTFVLDFLTGALSIFTLGLWCVTFKGVRDQGDATRKSLGVANKTLGQSRESSESQLRAYLTGIPKNIRSFSATKHASVDINLRNDGVTPAYGIKVKAEIDLFIYDITKEFAFPPAPENDWPAMIAFPRDTYLHSSRATRIFNESEIRAILNGNLGIYVWGRVEYKDIFKNDRFSEFYYRVRYDQAKFVILASGGEIPDIVKYGFEPIADMKAN